MEVDLLCTCHVSKRMSEPVHAMMQPYVRVYFLAAMLWHHLVVATTLIPGQYATVRWAVGIIIKFVTNLFSLFYIQTFFKAFVFGERTLPFH